ncbi:hypoxanthine phosphoribosyltransferase [Chloroflexota bacterium]
MSSTVERACYKAIRRAIAAVASVDPDVSLKDKLDTIIRGVARSLSAGASLALLDTTKKKLIHMSSWSLPKYYLQKGVLDSDKSLSEVISGQPVVITDVANDDRIQYPEIAARAGIVSILGVPVISGASPVGSIRVYIKKPCEVTNQDISFVTTMANLVSVALNQSLEHLDNEAHIMPLRQVRSVTFANPSEKDLAQIMDFYNIEWVYEPKSFPLSWEDGKITGMFTPDFYLPALDLYIEVTTLKQSSATKKNRKLRLLKNLYPEVKIMLLHKSEYAQLLVRYGCGPLANTRVRGISRVLYSSSQIKEKVKELAKLISKDYEGRQPIMVGMQRGFICFMADLVREITIPLEIDLMTISYYNGNNHSSLRITKDLDLNITDRHVIVVEDVVDTGMTLISVLDHLRSRKPASLAVCTLLDKHVSRIVDIPLDYIGFVIREKFVVGYGLDYKEEFRNLPFIGIPVLEILN